MRRVVLLPPLTGALLFALLLFPGAAPATAPDPACWGTGGVVRLTTDLAETDGGDRQPGVDIVVPAGSGLGIHRRRFAELERELSRAACPEEPIAADTLYRTAGAGPLWLPESDAGIVPARIVMEARGRDAGDRYFARAITQHGEGRGAPDLAGFQQRVDGSGTYRSFVSRRPFLTAAGVPVVIICGWAECRTELTIGEALHVKLYWAPDFAAVPGPTEGRAPDAWRRLIREVEANVAALVL